MFGILKLNIKGTGTIASVNVRDNAGGSMCGQYKMSEGKLVPDTEVQYDNVTLNCKTGSNGGTALTATGVDFHIVVPARTYAKGFTITISEVGGHAMVLNSTTPRTIQAGHILSTPSIAYNYPSDQIYEYHLDNLVFGSDPVGGRKGFLCPDYKDGFELCTCLTDNSEQAGTANYSSTPARTETSQVSAQLSPDQGTSSPGKKSIIPESATDIWPAAMTE